MKLLRNFIPKIYNLFVTVPTWPNSLLQKKPYQHLSFDHDQNRINS